MHACTACTHTESWYNTPSSVSHITLCDISKHLWVLLSSWTRWLARNHQTVCMKSSRKTELVWRAGDRGIEPLGTASKEKKQKTKKRTTGSQFPTALCRSKSSWVKQSGSLSAGRSATGSLDVFWVAGGGEAEGSLVEQSLVLADKRVFICRCVDRDRKKKKLEDEEAQTEVS